MSRRTDARWHASFPNSSRVIACFPSRIRSPSASSVRCNRAALRTQRTRRFVVLTPGVHNSAYFEHSLLARQMGVELVEGRDLVCHDNVVHMRTTAGEQRVDVDLPTEQMMPILTRCISGPTRSSAAPGSSTPHEQGTSRSPMPSATGPPDDKLIYTYVPSMVEYYLGEEAPSFRTCRRSGLEDPDECEIALSLSMSLSSSFCRCIRRTRSRRRPPSERRGSLLEPPLSIKADPRSYIAQEFVRLSTVPTKVGDRLAPRHVDLRPFTVNDGTSVWVVPGGLS